MREITTEQRELLMVCRDYCTLVEKGLDATEAHRAMMMQFKVARLPAQRYSAIDPKEISNSRLAIDRAADVIISSKGCYPLRLTAEWTQCRRFYIVSGYRGLQVKSIHATGEDEMRICRLNDTTFTVPTGTSWREIVRRHGKTE